MVDDIKFNEIEVFGIGAPIYAMNFTPNMVDWIERLPITRNKTRFFLFDTNAGLPGDAIKHIRKILEQKGYKFVGAIELVAPTRDSVFESSYFKYVKWTKKNLEKAMQFGIRIGSIITKGEGELVMTKSTLFGGLFRSVFSILEKPFYKNFYRLVYYNAEKCEKCRACEKSCPTDAISIDHSPVINRQRCMACFNCMRACPSGALTLKLLPNAKYFMGPKTARGYIPPKELLEEYKKKLK